MYLVKYCYSLWMYLHFHCLLFPIQLLCFEVLSLCFSPQSQHIFLQQWSSLGKKETMWEEDGSGGCQDDLAKLTSSSQDIHVHSLVQVWHFHNSSNIWQIATSMLSMMCWLSSFTRVTSEKQSSDRKTKLELRRISELRFLNIQLVRKTDYRTIKGRGSHFPARKPGIKLIFL